MSEEGEIETIETETITGEIRDTLRVKRSRIITVNGKIIKETRTGLYIASCGHLIRSVEEVGGRCSIDNCGAVSCKECSRVCSRCLRLLCVKHQKLHRKTNQVLCPRCWWVVTLFGSLTASKNPREEGAGRRHRSFLNELFWGPPRI